MVMNPRGPRFVSVVTLVVLAALAGCQRQASQQTDAIASDPNVQQVVLAVTGVT